MFIFKNFHTKIMITDNFVIVMAIVTYLTLKLINALNDIFSYISIERKDKDDKEMMY